MIVHLVGHDITHKTKSLQTVMNALEEKKASPSLSIDAKKQGHELSQKEALSALRGSDVVIIEASNYSFEDGFQLAAALEWKKPTLIISKHPLSNTYISGLANRHPVIMQYASQEELGQKVAAFLKKNTIFTKDLRFNLLFTPKIFNYIDDESKKTGKKRSDIVREIIVRQIEAKESR